MTRRLDELFKQYQRTDGKHVNGWNSEFTSALKDILYSTLAVHILISLIVQYRMKITKEKYDTYIYIFLDFKVKFHES